MSMDADTAIRSVKTMSERAKLLRKAQMRFHWSDGVSLVFGLFWICLAFWVLDDIKTYKAYDMQRLTPTHLLSPALDFTLGLMLLTQAFISATSRRVDALTKLLEHPQEP